MAARIAQLRDFVSSLGLQINMSKYELVPAVPEGVGINWELFDQNMPWKLDGCFKLLGAHKLPWLCCAPVHLLGKWFSQLA